jgi:SHS2 domain-containing protein
VRYRYIDQTSDLGVEILGKDLPELFANASFTMFDNILHLGCVVARESRAIELKAGSLEELFMDWLRELLFRFSTEYFVVKEVTNTRIEGGPGQAQATAVSSHSLGLGACADAPWRLAATVKGEKFDPNRHQVKIEIKTPTYHMFKIVRDGASYRATVVFDV